MDYFTLIKIRIKNMPIIGFWYRFLGRMYYYTKLGKKEPVHYYNFWGYHSDKNPFWMDKFIRHRQLNPKKKSIFFYSVFGKVEKVKKKISGGGGKWN